MEELKPSARGGGAGDGGTGLAIGCGCDPTPLLHTHHHPQSPRDQVPACWTSPCLLRGAAARPPMRSPSMAGWGAAGLRLEGREADWGCSRSLVVLDLVWSLAFVLVSLSVLLKTVGERPPTPVRAWVLGYALHCLVHVGFVCFEYRRRWRRRRGGGGWMRVGDAEEEEEGERSEESRQTRFVKKLESMSAVASFLWWILGFYWIVLGGEALPQDAPRLYWLTVIFLAFDVFFAIICITLACIIGIALCCCLPCIVAILYAVVGQEGASDADLESLPRFRFCKANQMSDPPSSSEVSAYKILWADKKTSEQCELFLQECCICLSRYEDGVDLRSLPCGHRFHSGCIVRWLRINATCPLCKFSILGGDDQV
ncbi:hypothetical protein Taro_032960 [Colocasia esculenta]|uniref:RING-type E3 ubiquitin transferase n=1 Tax=Colocasia esculenta TaxID=4460 RepID=A0A843WB16_COLES|nr:hypothetical protein [Colocasia esculenta]